jgi:hypothetical protein
MRRSIFSYLPICMLLFASAFFIQSCEETFEPTAVFSHEYYPVELDKYRIYAVDSIVYDEYSCISDTVQYQLKEIVTDTSFDGANRLYYVLNRYVRPDSSSSWTIKNVWKEQFVGEELHRVEQNLRFINLVFPINETMRWNGLQYILSDTTISIRGSSIDMFKDWDDFTYSNINEPYNLEGSIYPETVTINQVDKINNIERRYSAEVYAKDIGLIFREQFILDTQCRNNCKGTGDIATCINTPWIDKAERGFILRQRLIDYN